MTKNTIDMLESIGYFKLDENLLQRLANGRDNMLAGFGNNKAAGRLDVGAVVVGLEAELKQWMGANGIKNLTKGDFAKFLGVLEKTHGVKLGAGGTVAETEPTPAGAPADSPPPPETAAAPEGTVAPGSPLPLTIKNMIDELENAAQSASTVDDADVKDQITASLEWSKHHGNEQQVKAELQALVTKFPNSAVAKSITAALHEGALNSKHALLEDDQHDPADPASWGFVRDYFKTIARNSYNNASGGGGGANPAAGGGSGGGSPAAGGGDSAAAAAGGAATAAQTRANLSGSSVVHVELDLADIHRSLFAVGINHQRLNDAITSPDVQNADVPTAAIAIKGAFPRVDQAYDAVVILLRAIAAGRS